MCLRLKSNYGQGWEACFHNFKSCIEVTCCAEMLHSDRSCYL